MQTIIMIRYSNKEIDAITKAGYTIISVVFKSNYVVAIIRKDVL
jgi:hypothetical protein